MRFVWLTDPWNCLDHSLDTTLRLAEEALLSGHECFWGDFYQLTYIDQTLVVPAKKILSIRQPRSSSDFTFLAQEVLDLSTCDLAVLRADPPMTIGFVNLLQMLRTYSLTRSDSPRLINPPDILLAINSKIICTTFLENNAKQVITRDCEIAREFGTRARITVLKPLNGAQSLGISILRWETSADRDESLARIETAIRTSGSAVALQEYYDARHMVEMRHFFVFGEPIGTVRKRIPDGETLFQYSDKAKLEACSMSSDDRRLELVLGNFLSRNKIALAAVDCIGENVIDVNIVSPGLLVEMEEALSKNLANVVVRKLTAPTRMEL